MKRKLFSFPVILACCVLITVNSLPGITAPATNPAVLVAPPEGGLNSMGYYKSIYTSMYSPPFRGAWGVEQQDAVPLCGAGGQGGKEDDNSGNKIKIGLLIQTTASVEAKYGAEMAIDEANKKGGFNGRKFELVIKSMEGPWGTGSKQAVDMIFTDGVLAIIGSHDGRNAHLVEQATTKAHITFLSAWTGDPTLTQAFTPWFFNCVPNDNQQAEMLALEIRKQKYSRITLVTDDDYDAKSSLKSFITKTEEGGFAKPVTILIDKSDRDMTATTGMISKAKSDCLVLFTEPLTAGKIIRKMKEMNISVQVYGPLSLLKESSPLYSYPEVMNNLFLLSSGEWFMKEKSDFSRKYYNRFKCWPEAAAAYSYDAMMLMVNAVLAADADKEKLYKAVMDAHYNGSTGSLRFDDRGNRILTYGMHK